MPGRDDLIKELDKLRHAEKLAEKEVDWQAAQNREYKSEASRQRLAKAEQELFIARQALGVWIQTRGLLLAQITRQVVASNGDINNRSVSV